MTETVDTPSRESFARLLRTTRAAKQDTQAEVAAKVGTRQAVLSRWEHGALIPEDKHMAPLARYFGVRADDVRKMVRLQELLVREAELEDRLAAIRREIHALQTCFIGAGSPNGPAGR